MSDNPCDNPWHPFNSGSLGREGPDFVNWLIPGGGDENAIILFLTADQDDEFPVGYSIWATFPQKGRVAIPLPRWWEQL